jgi:hypothetical protein
MNRENRENRPNPPVGATKESASQSFCSLLRINEQGKTLAHVMNKDEPA